MLHYRNFRITSFTFGSTSSISDATTPLTQKNPLFRERSHLVTLSWHLGFTLRKQSYILGKRAMALLDPFSFLTYTVKALAEAQIFPRTARATGK